MKKLFLLFTLCLMGEVVSAQEYASTVYKTSGTPEAVLVSGVESMTFNKSAAVDKSLYISSKWKGKKVGFLGSSITEDGEYVRAYQELTGCIAYNFGLSDTHMAKINGSTTNAFETRCNNMPNDLDLVIVFGGTNDFGHTNTADFGQFGDGTNPNTFTFYAGLHRLFNALNTKYRKVPVVIMTPIHHGVEVDTPEYAIAGDGTITEGTNPKTGKTFLQYVKAIKEVANYYSFVVLDAYSYSGLSPMMEIGSANRYYFKDGLRLSDEGGKRLAKWMYPQLEQVYNMYY